MTTLENKGETLDLTPQEKEEVRLLNREILNQKLQYADTQVQVDQLEAQLATLKQQKASMLANLLAANQKMYDRVVLALKIRNQDPDLPSAKRWNFNPETMQFIEVVKPTAAALEAQTTNDSTPKQLQ